MERTLVLIRHAKSDWSTVGQPDFERPLNERGKRDAPVMGNRLKARGLLPDLMIASPARRAADTARLIAAATGYDTRHIRWVDRLYHAAAAVFDDVLMTEAIPDEAKTVFLFSHNPGITYFANETTDALNIDNIPTCGMVALTFNAEHWRDYPVARHSLLFFDYPKNQ